MLKQKLNLQLFADTDGYEASAVKGSRLFIGIALPITLADEVAGVKETSDKGGDPDKVDVTTIKNVATKNADGVIGSSDDKFTFFLDNVTLSSQMALIGEEVYIYEEYEDTSSDPDLIGAGFVYRAKLNGINPAGQTSNTERTFSQTATRLSDEYYRAVPTGVAGSQTFTYTSLFTNNTVTEF